jgi:hypothetical protein
MVLFAFTRVLAVIPVVSICVSPIRASTGHGIPAGFIGERTTAAIANLLCVGMKCGDHRKETNYTDEALRLYSRIPDSRYTPRPSTLPRAA